MTMNLKREFVIGILHNGLIAKITACFVIAHISLKLMENFDCVENSDVVLPVITGVLCTAMTFLFTKRDGKI